jgi:hypothetical protein
MSEDTDPTSDRDRAGACPTARRGVGVGVCYTSVVMTRQAWRAGHE